MCTVGDHGYSHSHDVSGYTHTYTAVAGLGWANLFPSNSLHISELVCDSLNMYLQQMCVCVCFDVCVFQVLHSMVSSVERPPAISAGCQLILRCKDFRIFQILIPQERDCADIHASLLRLSRPGMLKNNVTVNLFII